jgi:tyrosyl-tRNA synthetase
MLLHWLQAAGCKPIVLMGGGTTRIGDPSDKDAERPLLSTATITSYKKKIRKVFDKFIKFGDGRTDAVMEDNAHWLGDLRYLKFLREVGRHFTINRMLTLESVKRRLDREQPLTFMEFNYPLLQAADFMELNKRYGCRLQMGGSDQWGNIVQGVELCRRVAQQECFGLTSPLITTASGAKMGKTAQGAVWLSSEFFSVFDYWQFWRNCEDGDVGRFLKLFTTLSLDEIARLEELEGAEINDAKKVLATEATALLHGREEANKAEKAAHDTFVKGVVSENLPTFAVASTELAQGFRVAAAFVRAELVASNGEAKRQIAQKSLRVNDSLVTDETATLTAADLVGGAIKLSLGKKKHALLRVS